MKIEIENATKDFINDFVSNYHFYMNSGQHNASVDHKVILDGEIVGIFQYGYLPCSSEIAGYPPSETLSLSRMCFKIRKENLPTASLSKSIGKMKHEYAKENNIRLLVTYSRSDFEGTVYKAYGFTFDGISKGKPADKIGDISMVGNKPARDIYTRDKKRWVKELY